MKRALNSTCKEGLLRPIKVELKALSSNSLAYIHCYTSHIFVSNLGTDNVNYYRSLSATDCLCVVYLVVLLNSASKSINDFGGVVEPIALVICGKL